MKKLLAAIFLSVFMFGAAHAEGIYDPQHTMLALNMAIVSVHRILTTQDRIILEQEYQNIINNLSLGNIESDKDMTALYSDLTGIISRKRLRTDEAEFFRSRYDQREQNLMNRALSRIQSQGENIFSLIGGFAVSCVSSYFAYQAMKSDIAEELRGELWQLTKEDITDCNNLQERLLNSSWNLLRQYGLPDSYRLVQRTLDDFYKAVNEKDPARRFRMLRELERDFQVYPPYWLYRGKTAQALGNNSEAHSCFERFNEVWRPVLRQDPYKVEALKFELSEAVKGGSLSEEEMRKAFGILEAMTENTPRDDWANRLFEGVAYFLLGEKGRGIEIVESNVDFGYGVDVSSVVLAEMKNAEGFTFRYINESIRKYELIRRRTEFVASVKDSGLSYVLTRYFASCDVEAFAGFECLMRGEFPESKQYFNKIDEYCDGLFIIGTMYAKGLEAEKDYLKAATYYEVAARLGHLQSQFELGNLYYDGGPNLKRDYMIAYKWYQVIYSGDLEPEVEPGNSPGAYYTGQGIAEVLVSPLSLVWNVFTLGGFFHWTGKEDIRGLAWDKCNEILGYGWFNLSKGSPEERNQARRDAQAIIKSIPIYQANWKQ